MDLANQLRSTYTCYRAGDDKWWRPLWWWLIDICITNAYVLWKATDTNSDHRQHRRFHDELIDSLLAIPQLQEVDPWDDIPLEDIPITVTKKGYCCWGLKSKGGCEAGSHRNRSVLGEIVNSSRAPKRPRQVRTGCKKCGIRICTDGKCWDNWHSKKSNN